MPSTSVSEVSVSSPDSLNVLLGFLGDESVK